MQTTVDLVSTDNVFHNTMEIRINLEVSKATCVTSRTEAPQGLGGGFGDAQNHQPMHSSAGITFPIHQFLQIFSWNPSLLVLALGSPLSVVSHRESSRSGEKDGDGMRRDVCGMSGLNALQREECGAGSGFGTAVLRLYG